MGIIRKYSAVALLIIFGWYFSGINLFPHVHIVNGNSIVHSHFGGTAQHDHSGTDYTVIDMLSSFQTEAADCACISPEPFLFSVDNGLSYYDSSYIDAGEHSAYSLRGPPQA